MSDLAAAASKLGVSEAILKRSADARAKAAGVSVDELLAAWAGGGAAPAAAPAVSDQPPATSQETETVTTDEQQPAPVEQPTPTAPKPTPAPAPAGGRMLEAGDSIPVLVGRTEGMALTLTGTVGLLVLSVMLGFFLPSIPQPATGVRSSNHAFSQAAHAGREIYLEEGCGSCHTQLVRNVVPDVNIGPVTLDDTNQVIGYRRIGPDLSAVGSRMTNTEALVAMLAGEGNHPTAALTESELGSLIAYLRESR